MKSVSRRRLAGALTLCLAAAVAACGGTGDDEPAGPVTIEYWAWAPGLEPTVAKFNETHDDIELKLVQQADNPTTATGLRNAVAAGQGVPCLVQNFGEIPSLLSEGLLTDVTEYMKPYEGQGLFTEVALKGAQVQGKYFGTPTGGGPSFMMINRAVYDEHGIAVPKTWDDIIAAGEMLKGDGIQVMNLAGEDPSTLVNLVIQAGGTWYSVDGESWRVSFTSPESLKAADILQRLVDGDMVANQTYQDRPALIAYFDEGKMVSLPTSTWQLGNYETNFKNTLGDWQPIDLPQYADAPTFVTPFGGGAMLVPKGCANPEQATEVGVWMASSKDAIDSTWNEETKSYSWPGAIPDPSPWVDSAVPANLFGDHRAEARDVILKAVASGIDNWDVGPNYTGVFTELQDQWAKAVTKEITFVELLEHMQQWTIDDLKAKGINVVEG